MFIHPPRKERPAFTMGQLLVVILLVAIAVPLSFPLIQRWRNSANRQETINRIKEMSLALHSCNDVHKRMPPATGTFGQQTTNMSLSVHLLPYVKQKTLFNSIVLDGTPPIDVAIPLFVAPLDFTHSNPNRVQNFAANVRVFTISGIGANYQADIVPGSHYNDTYASAAIPKTFVDGTSNTIVFSTRYANNTSDKSAINCSAYDAHYSPGSPPGPYGAFFGAKTLQGQATALSPGGFQVKPNLTQANCDHGEVAHSFETAGIVVGLGDASARAVSSTITSTTWNMAMCPNDGTPFWSDVCD